LLREKKATTSVIIDEDKYFLISYLIPELNWYIIKFIKES
jgi:hypothetical protein